MPGALEPPFSLLLNYTFVHDCEGDKAHKGPQRSIHFWIRETTGMSQPCSSGAKLQDARKAQVEDMGVIGA